MCQAWKQQKAAKAKQAEEVLRCSEYCFTSIYSSLSDWTNMFGWALVLCLDQYFCFLNVPATEKIFKAVDRTARVCTVA